MHELRLPDLGEGLTDGEVVRWLVAEGDEVAEDQPLVEVSTDKTTVEIPSPAAGTVARILVAEGEVVPVGTPLVLIGAGAAPPPRRAPRATPAVRRLARELGVELATVPGTGPDGRVTEEDVRAARAPAGGRRVRLRGARRLMAERLAVAHREVAAVTFVEECDFSRVDPSLLLPTVLHAVARTLRGYPELNARLEGDEVVLLDRVDLGVAVETDRGLLVPVVRAADRRSVEELRAEVDRLAAAARAGTLTPGELRDSTFTVTSAGKLGGLFVTPLVNHPEVAILGVHRVAPRPVVRDGAVVVRPVGNLSVTFDHRVVDGARAAAFALALIRTLEVGEAAAAPP